MLRSSRFAAAATLAVFLALTSCNDGGTEPPDPAVIVLSRTSVQFFATEAGADPAAQTVSISNGGGSPFSSLSAVTSYSAGQPTGWLSLSLGPDGNVITLTLEAETGTLEPGSYSATVAVTAGNASNSPQNITVTFTVEEALP